MKKIIALVLAVSMCLGMVLTVSAAPISLRNSLGLFRIIRSMFAKEEVEVHDIEGCESNIKLNNVCICRYDIVYAEGADTLVYYTAVALGDCIRDMYGIELDVKADTEDTSGYELIIGETNRESSTGIDVEMGTNEYVIYRDGKQIVMLGNSYMIAGGASALLNKYIGETVTDKGVNVTNIPTTVQVSTFEWEEPESVIYMIGDGMGFNHIAATKELRDMPVFYGEEYPYSIKVRTFSYSVTPLKQAEYTDSAAAGTALATGYKTINGYLGLDKDENKLLNIRELAHSLGSKTAVLTTDHITGATPSAFLVHINDRNEGEDIQNEIDALRASGAVDFAEGTSDGDDLTDQAREALSIISADNSPYFIMIEEAYIDKACHSKDLDRMLNKVVRFNDCIAYCTAFTVMHPDSMLIITADHETGAVSKPVEGWTVNQSTHTNSVVPIYALGYEGLADLIGTKRDIDNTSIPKFIAKVVYGVEDFGDQEFGK